MRNLVVFAMLMMGLVSCSRSNHENGRQIVLPNPSLLKACPSKHPPLWRDPPTGTKAIYPAKFHVDFTEGGCSYGFMAWYDKSVSFEQMRQAINQRYGKWEKMELLRPGTISIWRIEPERFVISLTEVTAEDAKVEIPLEPGMPQLIYLPIAERSPKSICDCR